MQDYNASPKFSIITPVYNSETFLHKCIDSIIQQKEQDWELVLIDDGSTDQSLAICEEYARHDKRIVVIHQKNAGVSNARNVGIDRANGKWITFIDSDDSIEGDYFNITNLDEVDLGIQKWKFTKDGDTIEPLDDAIYAGDSFECFMKENLHKDVFRAVCAKFLKKDIIENHNIKFDEGIRLGEDTVFFIEYYKHINSISVNSSGCYLYYRPDNWGMEKYHLSVAEYKHFYTKLWQAYKDTPFKSERFVTFIRNFYKSSLRYKRTLYNDLYISTIPGYLLMNRYYILSFGKVAHMKYWIQRCFSVLHYII